MVIAAPPSARCERPPWRPGTPRVSTRGRRPARKEETQRRGQRVTVEAWSRSAAARAAIRSPCGTTVYFGSRALAIGPLSLKTGTGVNRDIGLSPRSRQGSIAVGEERVQLERPQPRSGEDERPGPET